jgi:RNA polymerase sigma factor (sigma-70 family)
MFNRHQKPKLHHTTEDLLRQYQATHDPVFAAELYQRHIHLVYGTCFKYLKDEEDSKDAVMQIFEKLLPALKNQHIQKFESWLYVLVKNYCLMELRNRKLRANKMTGQDLSELSLASEESNPEEALWHEQRLNQLEAGMSQIPEEQRICLDLFYLQKKCYLEICEITGFELNKVKSYIQNGKRNLKNYLEKHHEK